MVSGLACECFEGAAEFLAARRVRQFDCLVTDIRMPGMSGIDLIERLRDARAGLPVIVLSSVLDEATRSHALAIGARAWLTDRKSVVSGTSAPVSVDLGGRRHLKKNNTNIDK